MGKERAHPKVAASFTGFVDRAQCTLDFDPATRTFTVTPVGAYFDLLFANEVARYTTQQSIVLPDTTGNKFVKFDATTRQLAYQDAFADELIYTDAFVATVWWRADLGTDVHRGNECHGLMNAEDHAHWHHTVGSMLVRSLRPYLTNMIVDGNGSLNSHIQFGLPASRFEDEDIPHDLPAVASTVGGLPIWYFDAVGPVRVEGDAFPVIYPGKGGWAGARVAYQGPTGLVVSPNNSFTLMHLYGVNDWRESSRWMLRVGGNYPTKPQAQAAAPVEIDQLGALPIPEFVRIASLIINVRDSDTNTPKCHFVSTAEGGAYVDWTSASGFGQSAASPAQQIEVFVDNDPAILRFTSSADFPGDYDMTVET